MRRRTALATLGTALSASLAGCLGQLNPSFWGPGSPDGEVRPDGDPETVPDSLDCDDEEFTRFPSEYNRGELACGEAGHFTLRIEKLAYEYGETARITLTNTSFTDAEINDYRWFNFEVYTEDGWQDVRVTDRDKSVVYPDDGTSHEAGEQFQWEIELTEEGIENASFRPESTFVCPELRAGRYRFIFSNQFGSREDVAVGFDLYRDS